MRKLFYLFAGGMLVLAAACGGKKTTEVVVLSDTVTQTEVVEVAAPVDSAAITAQYVAEHAKTKATYKAKYKKQGKKEVIADSHPFMEHHEAWAPQPAAAATAAAPADPKVIVVHDVNYIYFRPDEKASFPGGEKAFDEFLVANLTYPEDAMERNVQGTVYAAVYLDELGNVTKVEFPGKKLGYGLEEETERILMKSPRWMPARHGAQKVKSKLAVPVTFEIKM